MIKSVKNFKSFTVSVFGEDFEVVADNTIEEFGLCECDNRRIKINIEKHKNIDQINATLFHEMIHAALFISGVSDSIENQEESLVRCIENAMWKHLKFRG